VFMRLALALYFFKRGEFPSHKSHFLMRILFSLFDWNCWDSADALARGGLGRLIFLRCFLLVSLNRVLKESSNPKYHVSFSALYFRFSACFKRFMRAMIEPFPSGYNVDEDVQVSFRE
jgi:hypothetical protein